MCAAAKRRCAFAAPGRRRPAASPTAAESAARTHRKHGRLIEVHGQFVAVTVRDRAALIRHRRGDYAAVRAQLRRAADGDALDDAVIDGNRRVSRDGNEKAARIDEPGYIHQPLEPHAAAHVVGGVRGAAQVRRKVALLPRHRIAAHGRAVDDALRGPAHRAEQNHVPLVAKVGRVPQLLVGNVVVGNLQAVEGHPEPASFCVLVQVCTSAIRGAASSCMATLGTSAEA